MKEVPNMEHPQDMKLLQDNEIEKEIKNKIEKEIQKAFPKSDHIKEIQLIGILKPLLDTVTEDDLKIYNFSKGARSKVQFTQFPDICFANRQIFDATGMFKTMSQLDALSHSIGSSLLQYLLIVRKNIPLSKRTKKFIQREEIRNFRGKLRDLMDDIGDLCDFFNKKMVNKVVFDRDISDLIESFDTEEEINIAAKLVDELLNSGELFKSKDRIRKEDSYWKAKYSKLNQQKSGKKSCF